ncbi:MAG: serine/threonine-protein kinase [Candidatus Obscuribacterales bacterium]
MAELELSVKYKPLPAKIGFAVMTALMPLWAIIVPFCFGLFLTMVVTNWGDIHGAALPIAGALIVLGTIPILAILMAAVCEDDRIVVSKEGLSFPLFMLPKLRFRRERHWNDLIAAQVQLDTSKPTAKDLSSCGFLSLFFRSGGRSTMDLSRLAKPELEQLLLAIEVWGQSCKRSPELIEFQNGLQNQSRGIEFSYTQMWEEELSRRFSATSFVPLEPDRKLQDGRIKIVRQLAFGGLSAIYLAQENEKEMVVIKEAVVPANADEHTHQKAAELFEREARLLIKLNHENIARVFDHFTENNRSYMVLEYIRGQDLRQLVKQNGPQSEESVLKWAKQIASILAYLHSQDPPIIHRDLTPDNLVRKEDDTITLIDFGAANEFVGNATGTMVGKQAYIAPEQLRGKANLSSDIYALGGTMYFLLTGKDPEALMSSHPKEINAEISDAVDALVASCTEMEISDRPQSATALEQAIGAIIIEKSFRIREKV